MQPLYPGQPNQYSPYTGSYQTHPQAQQPGQYPGQLTQYSSQQGQYIGHPSQYQGHQTQYTAHSTQFQITTAHQQFGNQWSNPQHQQDDWNAVANIQQLIDTPDVAVVTEEVEMEKLDDLAPAHIKRNAV